MQDVLGRSPYAVERLSTMHRGPGRPDGSRPPWCRVVAGQDGNALRLVQSSFGNGRSDECWWGDNKTKSGRWAWHQGHSEEAQLGCVRASVPDAEDSGVAEKKRAHCVLEADANRSTVRVRPARAAMRPIRVLRYCSARAAETRPGEGATGERRGAMTCMSGRARRKSIQAVCSMHGV
jgi:hypothetical protein